MRFPGPPQNESKDAVPELTSRQSPAPIAKLVYEQAGRKESSQGQSLGGSANSVSTSALPTSPRRLILSHFTSEELQVQRTRTKPTGGKFKPNLKFHTPHYTSHYHDLSKPWALEFWNVLQLCPFLIPLGLPSHGHYQQH